MIFTYLLVEGPHDAAFAGRILRHAGLNPIRLAEQVDAFWSPLIKLPFPHRGDLLKRMPVPYFYQNNDVSVAIHVVGGDGSFADTLQESLAVLPITRLAAVGILLDTDSEKAPSVRFDELRATLLAYIPVWPNQPGAVADGPLRTGVFVLPDNTSHGTLEDLLLESAALSWPETLPLARDFVANAQATLTGADLRELRKPAGLNKATVACIGTLLRPGKSIQASIDDNGWLAIHSPRQQNLQTFLNRLIGR
ncbi:MAG: hypothetical protein EXQ57_10360 [Bryobacterales bacterium]|nr:hypothetical protein [Bryobacterales bacterium]